MKTDGTEAKNYGQSNGGRGQRAGINLTDGTVSRKAEKSEVPSTLGQATCQHSRLARTAMPGAEAEEAGICTGGHRQGKEVGFLHPKGRCVCGGCQPLLSPEGIQGHRNSGGGGGWERGMPRRKSRVRREACGDCCHGDPQTGQVEGASEELCDTFVVSGGRRRWMQLSQPLDRPCEEPCKTGGRRELRRQRPLRGGICGRRVGMDTKQASQTVSSAKRENKEAPDTAAPGR